MAGDWIKMRVSLAKDPAVIAMADHLAEQRAFMDWLTDPVRCHCKESAYEHVTRNVTVAVTVSALLVFWGVANEVGKPDGDDLVLRHATLESVDESSGVPGFGDAMAYVDWAIAEEQGGRYQLRLPKFLINNVPAEDRSKKGNAERQRRFREKHALEGNDKSNVTDNVTVTHREEKRREEKKEQKPLGHRADDRDAFESKFWPAYPRKVAKALASKAFAKINPDDALLSRMLVALERQRDSEQWKRDDGRFIPHAATWLNQRRWEDEAQPVNDFDPASFADGEVL